MTIGRRTRERRRELGYSMEDLSHMAGVTWSAVQRLESGQVSDPHYSTLVGIANALGMTVAELIGESAPKVSASPETGRSQVPANASQTWDDIAEQAGHPVSEVRVNRAEEIGVPWSNAETLEDFSRWAAARITRVTEGMLTELDNRFFDAVEAEPHEIDMVLRENTFYFLTGILSRARAYESELGKEPPRVQ